jgi:K+-sensing histidine kinase KdpD
MIPFFSGRGPCGSALKQKDNSCKTGTVSARETPDGCVIRVEDNGAGIPAELKERVFRDFHVRETELGLSIASQVLSITTIRIRETGEPGKGACFGITVPNDGYRFGTVPAQPGDPPAPPGRKNA